MPPVPQVALLDHQFLGGTLPSVDFFDHLHG